MNKGLNFYEGLDYQVALAPLSREDGGGWHAEHPELPGCASDGESPEKALLNLKEARRAWLRLALKRGREIPRPREYQVEEYSGKFTFRLPKSMHRRLAQVAAKEGVSLNQMILSLVSYGLGLQTGTRRARIVAKIWITERGIGFQTPPHIEESLWYRMAGKGMWPPIFKQ